MVLIQDDFTDGYSVAFGEMMIAQKNTTAKQKQAFQARMEHG